MDWPDVPPSGADGSPGGGRGARGGSPTTTGGWSSHSSRPTVHAPAPASHDRARGHTYATHTEQRGDGSTTPHAAALRPADRVRRPRNGAGHRVRGHRHDTAELHHVGTVRRDGRGRASCDLVAGG